MIPSVKRHCVLGEHELQSAQAARDGPPAVIGSLSALLTMCRRLTSVPPRDQAAGADASCGLGDAATEVLPNRANSPKSIFGKNRQQLIMLQARPTLVPFMAFGCDATQTIHRRHTMEALERGIARNRRRVAERFERPPNRCRLVSLAGPAPIPFEHDPLQEDGRH